MPRKSLSRRHLLKLGGLLGIGALVGPRLAQSAEQALDNPVAPSLSTGVAACDTAYRKAIGVIAANTTNGRFVAGANWPKAWTRDTAYAIDLACALIQPVASENTLRGLTEQIEGIGPCWVQDICGHFGGWPNLTDAISGTIGAWTLYQVTGDVALVAWAYQVTANSLARAERDAYDAGAGLFTGCASFMESNSAYPARYARHGRLVGRTKALSTNLLYYRAYSLAARMAQLLDRSGDAFQARAERLRAAINQRFWMPDRGYYAFLEDENGVQHKHMEACGEAFAVLWGVADRRASARILTNVPVTDWGIPCQWPQYPEWMNYRRLDPDYYHNGMVWPFVQGYWAWAAATQRRVAVFGRELEACLALTRRTSSIYEFYRPEDGAADGSARQLWSAAGVLSMIYHGLFGMAFQEDGITFAPLVPPTFESIRLTDVAYRQSTLSITVRGSGARIARFALDGRPMARPSISATLSGHHTIDIQLSSTPGCVKRVPTRAADCS
jgi:Bacterial alpha-L-rhamnosidase 6 hairpin glycosidase domain